MIGNILARPTTMTDKHTIDDNLTAALTIVHMFIIANLHACTLTTSSFPTAVLFAISAMYMVEIREALMIFVARLDLMKNLVVCFWTSFFAQNVTVLEHGQVVTLQFVCVIMTPILFRKMLSSKALSLSFQHCASIVCWLSVSINQWQNICKNVRNKCLSPKYVRITCCLIIIICFLSISSIGLGLSICYFALLGMGKSNQKLYNVQNHNHNSLCIPYIPYNTCGGGQQGSNTKRECKSDKRSKETIKYNKRPREDISDKENDDGGGKQPKRGRTSNFDPDHVCGPVRNMDSVWQQ